MANPKTRPDTLKRCVCTKCRIVQPNKAFRRTKYRTLESWCAQCIRDYHKDSNYAALRTYRERKKRERNRAQRKALLSRIAQSIRTE